MIFEGPGGLRGIIFRSQIALGSVPAALRVLPGLKIAPRCLQERSWERPGGQKKLWYRPRASWENFRLVLQKTEGVSDLLNNI